MAEIKGVAFPVPKLFAQRFFEGKDFLLSLQLFSRSLSRGMKFMIYQSHEDTGFVGEARIKAISLADDPV